MDVVPNGEDFITSFDGEMIEEGQEKQPERVEILSSISPSPPPKESDVWMDIEDALHRWTGRILDAETRHGQTNNLRTNIGASLCRQQLDGFLNHQDIAELRFIADIWTDLLDYTSSYTIGCEFVKRNIIGCLLELYKLRQIDDNLFVESCLKL